MAETYRINDATGSAKVEERVFLSDPTDILKIIQNLAR
jgi:hypothetical protein